MAKIKLTFVCQQCGGVHNKWSGQCNHCQAWNSLSEESISSNASYQGYAGHDAVLTLMRDVTMREEQRWDSGSSELNRVLGGGIIPGSAILIGGDPGIGKSTLLLQTIAELSHNLPVLYVTGEESPQQITLRARRLGLAEDAIWLLADTHVEQVLDIAKQQKPQVLVIDSIQTMHTSLLSSAPGAVGQVRESAMQLVNYAKKQQIALFIVGHVTKEGHLAGPRVLEHMVDTVLYFEGETDSRYRMIRAVKNRFGAVNELGLFAMTEKGLKAVTHPSAIFLSRSNDIDSGSIITATKQGSRPLLVEVQALVDTTHNSSPRRLAVGIDRGRLDMLLAITHRHSGVATHVLDVFINVVGGLAITETSADLAIIFALLSSLRNKPLPNDLLVFGEVGLAGELRPINNGQERLKEAAKHGFKQAIIPAANKATPPPGMQVYYANNLKQALNLLDTVPA